MTDVNKNGDSGGLHFDEKLSERYLFGELSEAEQERFETAYFADDAFFERFLAVKTELLDLYSRGELDPETRARMEPHFLATRPRRKVITESGDFIRGVTAISARAATDESKPVAVFDASRWIDSLARFFTLPRLAGAGLLVAVFGATWFYFRLDGSGMEQPVLESSTSTVFPANPELEVAVTSPTLNTTANERPSSPPPTNLTGQVPEETADTAAKNPSRGKPKISPGVPAPKPRNQYLATRGPKDPAKVVELTGKVLAPNGETVAGATVIAVNTSTSLLRSTTTAADGSYQFTELPAGKYDITAEAAALLKTRIPPVTLTAQRSEVQIKMDGGTIVSITGDPETNKRERTQNITLEAVASRDLTEKNTIRLRSYTRTVGVWLAFEGGPHRKLSARITAVDGTPIWRAKDLKVVSDDNEKYARILVPARLLRRKDYIITLEGRTAAGPTETIREYYFHVERPRSDTPGTEKARPIKP